MIVALFLYQEQRLGCNCFSFVFNFLSQYYYYYGTPLKEIKRKKIEIETYELSISLKN